LNGRTLPNRFRGRGAVDEVPNPAVKSPEREHVGREATSLEHRGKMAVVGTRDETASSPRLRQHIGQRQAPHQMSAADPMASVDSEHDVQRTVLAVE
jgi:hypothetical protein